ncbi:MAG TPA: ABC transporter permease [Acidimicrobiia bacterium]|nr:ABC transporter permease [Acidimicrobiia bacterium]
MLAAVRMVGRSERRRQRWALLALAAVVALGLGASLASFAAAYRTDHAWDQYLRRAAVTDLVVNPSLPTQEFDDRLREVPHVRGMWTQDLLAAGVFNTTGPITAAEAADSDAPGEGIGSVDGRYTKADRLMVDSGRAPSGTHEVFVTETFRPRLDEIMGHRVQVGDEIPVSFFAASDVSPDVSSDFDPNRVVEPLGIERLRVSGFGHLPDEVFDDELFPRRRFVVSDDVTRQYTCQSTMPDASLEEIAAAVYPSDCSRSYRYYALDIDEPANVAGVTQAVSEIIGDLNATLPAALREAGLGYLPILTTQADLDARVDHSVQPTVVAFELFGVLAGAATLLVTVLGAARALRQARVTNDSIEPLGMERGARAAAIGAPVAGAVAVGVVVAIAVGYAGSRVGPAGQVRRVDTNGSFSLPAAAWLVPVTAFAVLFAVTFLVGALRVTRRQLQPVSRRAAVGPKLSAAHPAMTDGVRNALSSRRGGALLTGACCVAIAALAGAAVFGANLTRLVDSPPRYGWPWNAAVITNGGYGSANIEQIAHDLDDRDDVGSYDLLGFIGAVMGGDNVTLLVSGRDADPVDLPIVEGRAPREPGEVALGSVTADRLGLGVGDDVPTDIGEGTEPLKIVGVAVMPAIGQIFADRSGLGVGAWTIAPPEQMNEEFVTFVGVDLDSEPAPAFLADIGDALMSWDARGEPPRTYTQPIRPAEIVNAEEMQRGPLLLAGLLALALLSALALSMAATVNARRRDYAIFRSVGFTTRQVASSVRWLAITTVAIGVVVGIPAGVLLGRWTWRVFAGDLGAALDVTLPILLLALIAILALIAALLAAAHPAYVARRFRPAETLHTG